MHRVPWRGIALAVSPHWAKASSALAHAGPLTSVFSAMQGARLCMVVLANHVCFFLASCTAIVQLLTRLVVVPEDRSHIVAHRSRSFLCCTGLSFLCERKSKPINRDAKTEHLAYFTTGPMLFGGMAKTKFTLLKQNEVYWCPAATSASYVGSHRATFYRDHAPPPPRPRHRSLLEIGREVPDPRRQRHHKEILLDAGER